MLTFMIIPSKLLLLLLLLIHLSPEFGWNGTYLTVKSSMKCKRAAVNMFRVDTRFLIVTGFYDSLRQTNFNPCAHFCHLDGRDPIFFIFELEITELGRKWPRWPPLRISQGTRCQLPFADPTSGFGDITDFWTSIMTRLNLVGFRLSKMDPGNNFLGIFEQMESKESAGVISFRSHDPVT